MALMVVAGPPACGKSTIAEALQRDLGLPLLSKDRVKEALFDALGTGDREWSRRLSAAAFEVLFALAQRLDCVIIEGNFSTAHAGRIAQLAAHPVQVHVSCPPDVARRRIIERLPERHPGHLDAETLDELVQRWHEFDPLDLSGPLIRVDQDCDTASVVAAVRKALALSGP